MLLGSGGDVNPHTRGDNLLLSDPSVGPLLIPGCRRALGWGSWRRGHADRSMVALPPLAPVHSPPEPGVHSLQGQEAAALERDAVRKSSEARIVILLF